MVKKITNIVVLLFAVCNNLSMTIRPAWAIEQTLSVKYKTRGIEQADKGHPIVGFSTLIADANRDGRNEIVLSGNGYMRVFAWNGVTFEPMWKSPQFSYQYGPLTFYDISPLVPTRYLSGQEVMLDYLVFVYVATKSGSISADIYRLSWGNGKYELRKESHAPFDRFESSGVCGDGTTTIIGRKAINDKVYLAGYKWDGARLIEKWLGESGSETKAVGEILGSAKKSIGAFLLENNKKIGILSCDNGVEWKEVGRDQGQINLWKENQIGNGKSIFGLTKVGSTGELWTIQGSGSEYDYSTKLYVSQFDGKKFTPFSRVHIKGIDSNMIFNMVIVDADNDRVSEIVGVEEQIRKKIPRRNSADEGDVLLITSNLFLAKWNGKEYEVKWHRKAIDERVQNLAVGDITGDGKKEIVVTDENGYLYVFEMPTDN